MGNSENVAPTAENENPLSGWPVLSLFSGAGGLDLGFKNEGFHPVLAIDINPAAVDTYRRNHPESNALPMDLSSVDPTDVVCLWEKSAEGMRPVGIIGGPPCQAFSPSNVCQADSDPRRQLLFNYAGIVEAFKQRFDIDFFVLENVPGLLNKRHKGLFKEFTEKCDGAGFNVTAEILDAGAFGIAQRRRRLVVSGINRDRYSISDFELPCGNGKPLHVESVLRGLPEPAYCSKSLQTKDIPHHPNHVAMVPKSARFTDGSLKPGHGAGLSFKVLAWDAPSYTVAYGHNEVHVHPECHRRLSIYEAMLLQGFPDQGYCLEGTFTEQVQLVSNAVPPPLAEGIAKSIATALGYERA